MTETQTRKTFTFISRQAPYGKSTAQACLDIVLACSVFEQTVNYVFADDGVYQLLAAQKGEPIRAKTLSNALEALKLYGVENIFVDEVSLAQRGLTTDDLILSPETIDYKRLRTLIDQADLVFNL